MRSRTPIYYDEENNIRPYEIPITCEVCGRQKTGEIQCLAS